MGIFNPSDNAGSSSGSSSGGGGIGGFLSNNKAGLGIGAVVGLLAVMALMSSSGGAGMGTMLMGLVGGALLGGVVEKMIGGGSSSSAPSSPGYQASQPNAAPQYAQEPAIEVPSAGLGTAHFQGQGQGRHGGRRCP